MRGIIANSIAKKKRGFCCILFLSQGEGILMIPPLKLRKNQLEIYLETADLHEPSLDMFGAGTVERWFTEKEVKLIIQLAGKFEV